MLEIIIIEKQPHKAGPQWKFAGSFYYALVVLSLIGYGHSTPKTLLGKGKAICIRLTFMVYLDGRSPIPVICKNLVLSCLTQGRLKIWTEHSTLILLISKLFEVALPKF